MKTAIAQLALLVLAAMFLPVKGWTDNTQSSKDWTAHTYVSNQSSRPIRATIIYHFPGKSQFVDRLIPPRTDQDDEYSGLDCQSSFDNPVLQVKAWVDGSQKTAKVNLACDNSLVTLDNNDKTGVDIYQSVYGSINKPSGRVLATIYP